MKSCCTYDCVFNEDEGILILDDRAVHLHHITIERASMVLPSYLKPDDSKQSCFIAKLCLECCRVFSDICMGY